MECLGYIGIEKALTHYKPTQSIFEWYVEHLSIPGLFNVRPLNADIRIY